MIHRKFAAAALFFGIALASGAAAAAGAPAISVASSYASTSSVQVAAPRLAQANPAFQGAFGQAKTDYDPEPQLNNVCMRVPCYCYPSKC